MSQLTLIDFDRVDETFINWQQRFAVRCPWLEAISGMLHRNIILVLEILPLADF